MSQESSLTPQDSVARVVSGTAVRGKVSWQSGPKEYRKVTAAQQTSHNRKVAAAARERSSREPRRSRLYIGFIGLEFSGVARDWWHFVT